MSAVYAMGNLLGPLAFPRPDVRGRLTAMGALVMDRQDRAAAPDTQLARAAITGDGEAFAALYDRHERRAFNLCYRITGSREDAADATQDAFVKVLVRLPAMSDRELDFGAYLLTAARHASYDAMTRARRAEPRDEISDSATPVGAAGAPPPEDDPERRALLEAQQEEIRAANEQLPVRQREALALYEVNGLSYDEIAEELGMNRNSVAQLISRARIRLRDALKRTALASILPGSPDCERALPLIAMRDDDQLDVAGADADWLRRHMAGCETCRLGSEAMAEAGTSYRAWGLVPALEVLRRETIAKAAEQLGHDWSAVADRAGEAKGAAAGGGAAAGSAAGGGASAGAAIGGRTLTRIGRDALIAGLAGVVLLGGVLASRTHDGSVPVAPAALVEDGGLVGVDAVVVSPDRARRVTRKGSGRGGTVRALGGATSGAPAGGGPGAGSAGAGQGGSSGGSGAAVRTRRGSGAAGSGGTGGRGAPGGAPGRPQVGGASGGEAPAALPADTAAPSSGDPTPSPSTSAPPLTADPGPTPPDPTGAGGGSSLPGGGVPPGTNPRPTTGTNPPPGTAPAGGPGSGRCVPGVVVGCSRVG